MGNAANGLCSGLTWAGTFHAVGARLLREHGAEIGLDPAFTIHDREDSADLMNLVRHELGFSKMRSRFPTKGTCLAIYSRCVNADQPIDDVLATSFPWCTGWEAELRQLFGGLRRCQAAAERPRLRRPPPLLAAGGSGTDARGADRRTLRPCARRRVPGYKPAAGVNFARLEAGRTRADGRRRRRAGDLFLPCGDGAQYPRLSASFHAARRYRDA